MWISQIPTCWHLITSVYRAQGLACPWEEFNGAYLNKWNHTYRKKNWWFVTVSFGIRETAKLKSISTHFSLLVSDTTPVSETFFQIRGWSKGCHFLHLLREVQARCFISWQLYLLTQFSQYCTLKTAYDSKTSPCPSHYEQVKEAWSSLIATTARENNGTLVRLGLKPRDDAPTSMGRGWNACVPLTRGLGIDILNLLLCRKGGVWDELHTKAAISKFSEGQDMETLVPLL